MLALLAMTEEKWRGRKSRDRLSGQSVRLGAEIKIYLLLIEYELFLFTLLTSEDLIVSDRFKNLYLHRREGITVRMLKGQVTEES